MIKDTLMEIGGVGIYGVISILLFFTTFSIAVWRAFTLTPGFRNHMSSLPLSEPSLKNESHSSEVPHA